MSAIGNGTTEEGGASMSIQRAIELFEMAHEELHGAYRSGKMEGFVQAIIQAAANEVHMQMLHDLRMENSGQAALIERLKKEEQP
jgi:hypothetical protein